MLPQLSGIPLQTTEASSDSSRNLNTLLPVGRNVSATVVAVSKDQIQPEIFRLKLEINNRLIQMGVFQALPIGQKINVNRQSDGQIQITLPNPQGSSAKLEQTAIPAKTNHPPPTLTQKGQGGSTLKLSLQTAENSAKLPIDSKTIAAVISSRPIYPNNVQNSPQSLTGSTQTLPPQAILGSSGASVTINTTLSPSQNTVITPHNQGTPSTTLSNLPNSMTNSATGESTAINTANSNKAASSLNSAAQNVQGKQVPEASAPQQATSLTKNGVESQTLNSNTPATNKANHQAGANNTINTPPSPTSLPTAKEAPLANTTTEAKSATTSNSHHINSVNATSTRPLGPPSHHMLTLALTDGSKVELASPKPLLQGTQLQIVKTSSHEVQVLQIREPQSAPISALEKPAIQETLRNALPTQIATADAFSQLSQVASQAEGPQASQISNVVKSMLQLFGVRPGSQEAPSQIRQNIELGGLSTEHHLSKGSAPHPQEMKSQLQQLQKLADTLPAEQKERLEQLLQGIHSRVTSQQLNSLQQWREMPDGGFERVLQLDLPIKNGEHWDNLELRLSREGGTNAAGEMVTAWRVRLHFDLDEQGGVDAEIRLTDGHEISTLFWCELKQTADKLRERSEEFSERLRQCGFDSTEVNWHEGVAPEQKQAIHKQLVDLHT